MKVKSWNVYSTIRENARIVAATEHDAATVTAALDEAECFARDWNASEGRSDMLVTTLTCNGYVRSVPVQASLF